MRRLLIAFCLLVWTLPSAAQAQSETKLLRFPTIHGDQIVFGYAGDLYTVKSDGGIARRLTSHPGYEMFPRFSPDGKHVAFTGQYDGNTEVFVMPAEGGEPKRLTYTATLGRDDIADRMGPNNIVLGWTPDSKKILFRSRMQTFNDFIGQLYTVDVEGGIPEQLPLPRGGFASYSPDGKSLVYNRIFREFRTWKRYRGGMADDIWLYNFDTKKTTQLVDDPAQDIIPMWVGDTIYFLSDREPSMRFNLYSVNPKTKETEKLTDFQEFDIKFPSAGDSAIVFENGGSIYRFDVKTKQSKRVPVQILEDRIGARAGLADVSKSIVQYEISPDGKRALLAARGDLFSVPAKEGITRNLNRTPGAHERNAKFSPDGKQVAYISDESGEDEIYVMPADGNGKPEQLTKDADTYKYELEWSPDSKKILWADKKLRLSFVDVESKEVTLVNQGVAWELRDFAWSPDSEWIAFGREETESLAKVHLYRLADGQTTAVTDGWYDSGSPAFSADGKYLFFVSSRDFNPIYSQTEWNHAYRDMAKIYFVTLAKKTPNPLRPKLDEVKETEKAPEPKKDGDKGKDKDNEKEKDKEKKPKGAEPIQVDLDGIQDRIVALPIASGSYRHLTSVGNSLYYLYASSRSNGSQLKLFDLEANKETTLGPINGYEISADGKKMIVSKGGQYGIIDLPKGGSVEIKEPLNLSAMKVSLDRQAEWKQIFHECWRQMRDFFYDPNLHGVDWEAARKKYEPLVEHVAHRADLTYIIGEMISELNAGHAYIGGGEVPSVPRVKQGLLGAHFKRIPDKGFELTKILRGENWNPSRRSPLTEVGIDINVGDVIVAVNGMPASEVNNLNELLIDTAGRKVILRVTDANGDNERDVVVTPIDDESGLYYYEWVQSNIKKVSDATDGQVGYLHVPDMLQNGLNEFAKHYYPQLRKKALIVDVRGNGGGNVSPMLIERLRRQPAMVSIARNTAPNFEPSGTFVGPMACLLNEYSASDGDIFSYRFRHYKLGPLVGKRSWGGVVGIRGTLPLLDGASLNKPEFSRYDLNGQEWIMENVGVEPDIVVDNDPAKEFAGEDEQLQKGIELMLKALKEEKRTVPEPPPFPKR